MKQAERLERFKRIKERYDGLDREGLSHGKLPMHSTEFGFWGTTNMNDAYDLFTRIRLGWFNRFVDLGCGDGRVVAIASLFTKAVGIEGEEGLVKKGQEVFKEVGLSEKMALLKCKDYHEEELSKYDIIFMFPDNRYDAVILGKLLSEFKGYLFVYNRVHSPSGIKAGKTYWIKQMPIASYPINITGENLETR